MLGRHVNTQCTIRPHVAVVPLLAVASPEKSKAGTTGSDTVPHRHSRISRTDTPPMLQTILKSRHRHQQTNIECFVGRCRSRISLEAGWLCMPMRDTVTRVNRPQRIH